MYQIVKFTFPFADDFYKGKPRPSVVISPCFGRHKQLIVAYITTNLEDQLETDIFIDSSEEYFSDTGLQTSSLIKVHRLITSAHSSIGITIGMLPDELVFELKNNLRKIFRL